MFLGKNTIQNTVIKPMKKPYKMPKNYINWAKFLEHLKKISFISPRKFDDLLAPDFQKNLSYLFDRWSKGYPVYCVRQSLIDDMIQTDVGENIPLFLDIDLTIPNYLLCFPQKTVKSPVGEGYIEYLIVNIEENERLYPSNDERSDYKYYISWGCFDSNNFLIFSGKGININGTIKQSYFSGNEMQKNTVFLIRNIVLQSILFLQHCPETQQEMNANTFDKKGFSKPNTTLQKDYRFPRWLVGQLEIDNERSQQNEIKDSTARTKSRVESNEGSAKSKHYRRWHWRLQPCGEGRKTVKPVRVRGTWVNYEQENTVST